MIDSNERVLKLYNEYNSCLYREKVFEMWLNLSLRGICICDFFVMNSLKDIIVYGYGRIGRLLCGEIKKHKKLRVVAAIDRNADLLMGSVPIIQPDEIIPKHDVMIVTIEDFNYVMGLMKEKSNNIVSLTELIRGYGL